MKYATEFYFQREVLEKFGDVSRRIVTEKPQTGKTERQTSSLFSSPTEAKVSWLWVMDNNKEALPTHCPSISHSYVLSSWCSFCSRKIWIAVVRLQKKYKNHMHCEVFDSHHAYLLFSPRLAVGRLTTLVRTDLYQQWLEECWTDIHGPQMMNPNDFSRTPL